MTIEEAMFEFYEGVPIQGPGSESTTNKLLGLIPNLDTVESALDIGCGTGRTSLVLAKAGIHITAIDIHQPFLDYLQSAAQKANLDKNITTQKMSMDSLSLPEKSFDLIWSEASAYILSFEKALQAWKKLLKPNGYLVVTELCWTSENPSKEVSDFWSEEYPGMLTVTKALRVAVKVGFEVVDTLTLPESDWDNYYKPLKIHAKELEKDAGPEIKQVIELTLKEIAIRDKYNSEYDYLAFILRLTGEI
ncbi:MAG: class I SAM-dependent methyltransferase [Patescibacteria group bacterium]|jgi:SAM-dependent methyltransferase|nr:class I SAM-dependent methyltransferase [Patescibacteria group bacterium]